MSAVEVATKHCPTCDQDLPVSAFSRQRSKRDGLYYQCKPCAQEKTRRNQARRRAEMGDEAWRAHQTEAVRRHRSKPEARKADRLQQKAYKQAERRLREAHRTEFDALYRIARYELGLPIEAES